MQLFCCLVLFGDMFLKTFLCYLISKLRLFSLLCQWLKEQLQYCVKNCSILREIRQHARLTSENKGIIKLFKHIFREYNIFHLLLMSQFFKRLYIILLSWPRSVLRRFSGKKIPFSFWDLTWNNFTNFHCLL